MLIDGYVRSRTFLLHLTLHLLDIFRCNLICHAAPNRLANLQAFAAFPPLYHLVDVIYSHFCGLPLVSHAPIE